jgi:hypothetical protein
MSFFEARRLKAEAAEAARQEQVRLEEVEQQRHRTLDNQKITWVRETSNVDLLDVFAKFDESIRGVTQDITQHDEESRSAFARTLDAFQQIHRYWFEIDRNRITDEQAKKLFYAMHVELPAGISTYVTYALRYGLSYAWSHNASSKFAAVFTTLADIRNDQVTSFQANSFVPVAQNSNEVTLKFPTLSTSNSVVMSTLTRVNELWEQASTRKNSVEDEYFLEQVASTYIPDSWRLFQTFRFAPEASQATAEKLFLEQLALIETHLVRMLSTAMEQNLMAMRSQLGFLEARVAEPEPSQLTLEATTQS